MIRACIFGTVEPITRTRKIDRPRWIFDKEEYCAAADPFQQGEVKHDTEAVNGSSVFAEGR